MPVSESVILSALDSAEQCGRQNSDKPNLSTGQALDLMRAADIRIPRRDEGMYLLAFQRGHADCVRVASQHSGAYGPWYHVARYRRQGARLIYLASEGGHYRRWELNHLPTLSEAKKQAAKKWREQNNA